MQCGAKGKVGERSNVMSTQIGIVTQRHTVPFVTGTTPVLTHETRIVRVNRAK